MTNITMRTEHGKYLECKGLRIENEHFLFTVHYDGKQIATCAGDLVDSLYEEMKRLEQILYEYTEQADDLLSAMILEIYANIKPEIDKP